MLFFILFFSSFCFSARFFLYIFKHKSIEQHQIVYMLHSNNELLQFEKKKRYKKKISVNCFVINGQGIKSGQIIIMISNGKWAFPLTFPFKLTKYHSLWSLDALSMAYIHVHCTYSNKNDWISYHESVNFNLFTAGWWRSIFQRLKFGSDTTHSLEWKKSTNKFF